MNLNFIQDNDKIHVETQNQIAYNEEIILKSKLLKQDFQDYSKINPSLNHINALFSDIVKDLYEHVTNVRLKSVDLTNLEEPFSAEQPQNLNKKKKVSIPYGTVRKLQALKQKFIACRKIIEVQNSQYHSFNINRQNQKKSDVKFYKAVLQSYQNQRQYYKKQTLKLEDRVQEVQAIVKNLSYNDNHEFTDYESRILSYENIFKYEKKLSAFGKVLEELRMLENTKNKIRKVLDLKEEANSDKIPLVYGKNFIKYPEQMMEKINFLKTQKVQILQARRLTLENQMVKIQKSNQKFKKAILQLEGQKYFLDMENNIKKYKARNFQGSEAKKGTKMTKTDFMIYLKELDSRIKDYFKSKEIVFRCKVSSKKRSKSVNLQRF